MKHSILAAAFGILLAGPALAMENNDPFSSGDSHGPRQPRAVADGRSDSELNHQLAINKAWRAEAFRHAQDVGAWGDGILPVEYAAQAWSRVVGGGSNPNPAAPIGSSIGGSD